MFAAAVAVLFIIGSAWGAFVEFRRYAEAKRRYGRVDLDLMVVWVVVFVAAVWIASVAIRGLA